MPSLGAVGFGAMLRLARSRTGLTPVATRDAADAAGSPGVDAVRRKVLTFGVGALMAGLCSAFHAHHLPILPPHSAVGIDLMALIVAMAQVGGIGTVRGPIPAAFTPPLVVGSLRVIEDCRMQVYGALIMAVMTYTPRVLTPFLSRLPRGLPDDRPRRRGPEETSGE